MPSKTRKTGNLAEDKVVEYIKSKNWKVLARNFEKPWGEIDIIARDKGNIIFIEVKSTAQNSSSFMPELHFNHQKRQKLLRTCQNYLTDNNYPEDTSFRIDLAAVELDMEKENAHVRYYKNAIG